jgi:hypothetical protein
MGNNFTINYQFNCQPEFNLSNPNLVGNNVYKGMYCTVLEGAHITD